MNYILWYSCYIDLLKNQGVASVFLEDESGNLKINYLYKEDTTINELNLISVLMGFNALKERSNVHIAGVNSYVNTVLHKLGSWMKKEDEIDLKAHSQLLKNIWGALIQHDKITTANYRSRTADPMLWMTSQCSKSHYRNAQMQMINTLKSCDLSSWSYKNLILKSDFLKMKFENPLTDIQFEKKVIQRKKELKDNDQNQIDNIIPFPGA